MSNDHIVAYDATGKNPYRMECKICGVYQDVKIPISITDYVKKMEKFTNIHKDCKEKRNKNGKQSQSSNTTE